MHKVTETGLLITLQGVQSAGVYLSSRAQWPPQGCSAAKTKGTSLLLLLHNTPGSQCNGAS